MYSVYYTKFFGDAAILGFVFITDYNIGMDQIFDNREIQNLAKEIAQEFANRNLFAQVDFMTLADEKRQGWLSKKCLVLFDKTREIMERENLIALSTSNSPKPAWLASALFMSNQEGIIDQDKFAKHICIEIISKANPGTDEHIELLGDNDLLQSLGITPNDHMLVSLKDPRLELKMHGITVDKKVLVYPHQFLRRYYTSNFVGLPILLRKIHDTGASVSIRIDPLRQTTVNYYREVMEFDYWYGLPFSQAILERKDVLPRTVHYSRGYMNLSYDPRYTVFRTKMMDQNQREFMIEEYCPVLLHGDRKHPGVGSKFCIQKFAHTSYDQTDGYFSHIDGAVRVFTIEDYENYFKNIADGGDVDEKVGIRHKLFLVEGNLSMETVQELLAEWFRYNPHIMEYFTGASVEPEMTYADYDRIVNSSISRAL